MSSTDFAAAQARLAARRQRIEEQNTARRHEQEAAHALSNSRIPLPLRTISDAGLSVWDTIKGREGTRPAFRVGQVDAELLDDELLDLLKGQVSEALKYFGAHLQTDWSAEILLLLRAVLFKLTIWDHNASYGASLQGLRYTDARDTSLSRPPPKPWQKSIYGFLTVFGRYGWTKWEDYLVDQEGGYEAPPPAIRKLSRITSSLSTVHSITALASFLTFLFNGRYRTILDRVLKLRLVPASTHTTREVSFEYLNRQLVWHAFTEFLLFLLPLVGVSRWRRIANRSWRQVVRFFQGLFGQKVDPEDDDFKKGGELGFLPERTCAICYADLNITVGDGTENDIVAGTAGGGVVGSAQTDITNPYEAIPCGDVYCFVCITQRIEGEEGEGWTCLRCGETVKECKPWNGDVLETQPRPGSKGKAVGFFDPGTPSLHAHNPPLTPARSDVTMRELEPMPTEDELETIDELDIRDESTDSFVPHDVIPDLDMAESSEWARASEIHDETDDFTGDDDSEEDDTESLSQSTAWPQ
jgi:peroxin-2